MQTEDLTKSFVQTIKERIFEGEYRVGDSFPALRKLAQEFGYSRSVINVGIARLEAQGYLEIQKRKKTITNDFIEKASLEIVKDMAFSQNQILRQKASKDILQARKLVEIDSVRLAAISCDKEHLEELFEIIDKENDIIKKDVKDYKIIAENDYKFHSHLIKMSKNMVYQAIMNSLGHMALKMTKKFYKNNMEFFKEYAQRHRDIAKAIRENEGEVAAKILEEILTHGEMQYKNL